MESSMPSLVDYRLIEKETERAAQCYDALEDVGERFGRVMHMGSISTVAALGYAD